MAGEELEWHRAQEAKRGGPPPRGTMPGTASGFAKP
jgi:hypothetical protein